MIEPALSQEEWAKCVEIERSSHDPLTYDILSDPLKAMCWINGNLSDSDPRKFTREDVVFLRSLWNDQHPHIATALSLADRIEFLLPPEKEGA